MIFKQEWLKETVQTDTADGPGKSVKLSEIFSYGANGVVCKICNDVTFHRVRIIIPLTRDISHLPRCATHVPHRHNCALLNNHSLTGKETLLIDIIIERNLDFLFLTETWQMSDDFIALNLLTPPGYSYLTKPHLTGRGGGLAVVFKNNYKITKYDALDV